MYTSGKSRPRSFSPLAVWAIAFGCATGWGSFIMPGTAFLPKAGPLGASLGILIGGAIMAVIGWNYSRLMERQPGPGGALTYVRDAFGIDHGFLCAWFLSLTYAAIIWANATALSIVTRALFGNCLSFGPLYTFAGDVIRVGDLLLAASAVAVGALLCLRTRIAARAQGTLGLIFATGVAIVFAAALVSRAWGSGPSVPLPQPFAKGEHPVAQTLHIIALAPWLFVGFEAISHVSGELRFPLRRSFAVMLAGLGTSALVYVLLVILTALAPSAGAAPSLSDSAVRVPPFQLAAAALGPAGVIIIGAAAFGALFTNLVGNTLVTARLIAAMARDGILPSSLGEELDDGTPRKAILYVAAVSALFPLLGRTAIGFIVDVATVGAAIAYAYVSAAAYRLARAEGGSRRAAATGIAGVVLSLAVTVMFLLPNILSEGNSMATESYLILAIWSVAGVVAFFCIFHRDKEHRFGRSPVAWFSLLAMILFLSVTWMRQSTYEATEKVFSDIEQYGEEADVTENAVVTKWIDAISDGKDYLEQSVLRNSLVLTGTTVLAFVLLFGMYTTLRRREREAEQEKARAKSYFFSTVSHDIRTPLNAIIGYTEMLRNGFDSETERNQAIDSILMCGKTLLGLVNDVLELSKLESGRMEIRPEPTDIPALLARMAAAFRASTANPDVEIRCRTEAMPRLMLDPQRMRQIVFNLVGNAVKFTEHGYIELRAAWNADTGVFHLDVEDTGCGISEKDRQLVMTPYVQVASHSARNGGTGLGLAICKQLAKTMGGSLSLESEIGVGSTFSITLQNVRQAPAPLPVKEPPQTADEQNKAPAPQIVPDHSKRQGGGKIRRILVVDDVKMNLMVLLAQLRKIGDFEIATASDGLEALAMLGQDGEKKFDLVLTDIWMPNMDGAGLVKQIRADASLRSLRVIAVTADVEFKAKAPSVGFDGVLLKPVTADKLTALLA